MPQNLAVWLQLVLLLNLGGSCPFRDHRIEFSPMSLSTDLSPSAMDFDHYVVLCPTRSAAQVPTEPADRVPMQTVRPQARQQARQRASEGSP